MARINFNEKRIGDLKKKDIQKMYKGNADALEKALKIWEKFNPKKKTTKKPDKEKE